MLKRVDGWFVPILTFGLAVILSCLSGPSPRALGLRAMQDVTQQECCHVLNKKVPLPAFTNILPPEEAAGAFAVHIQVHANGNIFIKASAVNAHVAISTIERNADYEMTLYNKKDPCKHNARVGEENRTAFTFKLTGTKNFIPTGFGIGKGDIKVEASTVFLTDLMAGPRKTKTGLRLDLDEHKSTGIEFEIGKEGPKLKTSFDLEVGTEKDDTSFEDFEDQNEFHDFAKLKVHTEAKLDIAGISDFAGADGECSVKVKNPFIRDVQEDVFINFLDPEKSPDQASIREKCNLEVQVIDFENTQDSDEELMNHVKAQVPKGRPK